ncbi:hypothetical protein BCR32DRAFT_286365 [Anaeromyces robustus]|uniref:Uncharacterized protein n=1 Tax=Anaeromyces robustus TaxID=1754192 RepID=A0A1Y1VY00_9FUNG|nr:hypothetical protein BCR32DRAFT_286365 [Anaeromyces robustus]|eukprot:ORX66093.1 hypothetical protein BCR32DRAFT_286365 [Anaeromyces robustus]
MIKTNKRIYYRNNFSAHKRSGGNLRAIAVNHPFAIKNTPVYYNSTTQIFNNVATSRYNTYNSYVNCNDVKGWHDTVKTNENYTKKSLFEGSVFNNTKTIKKVFLIDCPFISGYILTTVKQNRIYLVIKEKLDSNLYSTNIYIKRVLVEIFSGSVIVPDKSSLIWLCHYVC